MSEWSFRYQGPPGGLRAALDAHADKHPETAPPEAVGILLDEELAAAAASSTYLEVEASGHAVDPKVAAAAEKTAAMALPCLGPGGVDPEQNKSDRVCQKGTRGCTTDHDPRGTGPMRAVRELQLRASFRA